ncbi:hypothetical protein R4R86_001774, partial [Citrobacter farmeri]
ICVPACLRVIVLKGIFKMIRDIPFNDHPSILLNEQTVEVQHPCRVSVIKRQNRGQLKPTSNDLTQRAHNFQFQLI